MAHTPVEGYRELDENELKDMNDMKALEQRVLDSIDIVAQDQRYTDRWISIARTHVQQGFMALNRAIARPNNETE
jgi:hypothetical protein